MLIFYLYSGAGIKRPACEPHVGTMMESHVYPYEVCVCDSDHICAHSNRGWTTACPSLLPSVFTRGRAESGCMREAVPLSPARGTL